MVLEESPEGAHNEHGHPNVDSEPDVFQRHSFPNDKGSHPGIAYTTQECSL